MRMSHLYLKAMRRAAQRAGWRIASTSASTWIFMHEEHGVRAIEAPDLHDAWLQLWTAEYRPDERTDHAPAQ